MQAVLVGAGVNMSGWPLREAHAVSADDLTVVGWGESSSGLQGFRAYLGAEPVPEPTALLLALLGGAAALAFARR